MTRILYAITLLLLGWVFISPALPSLEGRLFPVADHVRISEIEPFSDRPEGWVVLSGTARKLRDCEFLSIEWFLGNPRGGTKAQVTFLEPTQTRKEGLFSWGEWAIQLTTRQLFDNSYAVVTHDCHPFWVTKTVFWSSRGLKAGDPDFVVEHGGVSLEGPLSEEEIEMLQDGLVPRD